MLQKLIKIKGIHQSVLMKTEIDRKTSKGI